MNLESCQHGRTLPNLPFPFLISMVRETSAGGVVLRKMRGRWYVAVIEPHMDRPRKHIKIRKAHRTPADAELIALPKGSIDPGEKPEETALREIREETGIRADIIAKLADIKYIYVRNWGDRAKVFKIVSFYLLMYRSGRLGNIAPAMRIEVQNAFWLPLEEAATRLSYKGEREVVAHSLAYLKIHPELGEHAANSSH
jgi:8-oxo-dGTP pyrophosphatase MutT (NUDIX family)